MLYCWGNTKSNYLIKLLCSYCIRRELPILSKIYFLVIIILSLNFIILHDNVYVNGSVYINWKAIMISSLCTIGYTGYVVLLRSVSVHVRACACISFQLILPVGGNNYIFPVKVWADINFYLFKMFKLHYAYY